MFTFILYIALALVFGYFATQNTEPVSITLMGATLANVPLYFIMGATLLVGLAFSWFISLFDTLESTLKIKGKEHVIKDSKATINNLEKKIKDLEIENARLSGELKSTKNRPL